jgi:cyclopropane fatty-acyl-phospholipid synthase-like methyltransferase
MWTIRNNGIWEGVDVNHHNDSHLSAYLVTFLKLENVKSVVDFGCGNGYYVKVLSENDINIIGFDGNPNTPELTNNTCKVLDLSKPIRFTNPFDWVISFEVGEHLPKEFEDVFVKNLHNNNSQGIILSWAVEGQGGDGHFNERNNDYVKSKICNLGYVNDIEAENMMRQNASISWFKSTIMVFRKISGYIPPSPPQKKRVLSFLRTHSTKH